MHANDKCISIKHVIYMHNGFVMTNILAVLVLQLYLYGELAQRDKVVETYNNTQFVTDF